MFQEEIQKELTKLTKQNYITLEVPPDRSLGDFAYPCFSLANTFKKNPTEIAKDLATTYTSPSVEKVTPNGPYLNFFLKQEKLATKVITSILDNKDYGTTKTKPKTIMVEFFHANTHKGVHIGHIRNICLGESVCRLLEATSNKVIRVNYQGDIGPHVTKAIWGYLKDHKGEEPTGNRGVWLGKIYAEANKKIKDNEALTEEIRQLTKDLYAGKAYKDTWKTTRQWCLDDFQKMYKLFDVKFDRLYFESEVEKGGKKICERLVHESIAVESDGALIIDMKDKNLGVFVLVRDDGVPLYSAKDLQLAELKHKEYPEVDLSIHVVGKEQELYFKQLFHAFELYKGPLAGKSYHLIYELVMLPEGKMSSRDGNVVFYEDLKEKIIEAAKKEVQKRHEDWEEKKIKQTATIIAMSAIKFSMLLRDNNQSLVFDWKKALDFQGETGPYIQYSHARISSVLEKAGKNNTITSFDQLTTPEEEHLISLLEQFPGKVEEASASYHPHHIAHYLLKLCQVFNEFYHLHPILKAENDLKNQRLALINAVKIVLNKGLYLLGIDAISQM